ncbi:aldehyde dehydrogenase family protein, partial [Corynebacterium spheniscorum]
MSTPDIPRLLSAQARWAQVPLKERAAILLRLHDLVLDRQDELMDAIQADTHKNRRSAFEEVMDVAITARYYAHRGPTLLRPRRARGALPLLTRTEVTR